MPIIPPRDQASTPPSTLRIGLSILLLVLFAPVILAVGTPVFRPAWLINRVAGVPLSTLWVLGSIAAFIVLTQIFARMFYPDANESDHHE